MLQDKDALDLAVNLLKQGFTKTKISKELTKQGYSEIEIEEITQQAIKIKFHKADKIRRYIYIALTIVAFVISFFVLPIEFVASSPKIISFVVSVILIFLLVQSICNFRSFNELNPPKKPTVAFQTPVEDWRLSFVVIVSAIVSFFALIFIFNVFHTHKVTAELKEYGVVVKGTVINGSSTKIRRSTSYDVNVNFRTLTDESIIVNKSVTAAEFQSLHEGEEIDLIYSSRKPTIVELLLSASTIKDYINTEDREIALTDFITLLSFETNEDVGAFLNKTSYGWAFDSNEEIWSNERKSIALKVKPNFALMSYNSGGLYFSSVYMNSDQVLADMKFKKIDSGDKHTKSYESDKYVISLTQQISGSSIVVVTNIIKK